MRAFYSVGLHFTGAAALALSSVPAVAGLPGSTQPGAQPVAPGNMILMRVVPPRNAIISGAGRAITAPTAPPSVAFATIQGVGIPLSDAEAASVIGSFSPGQAGAVVATTIDGVFGSQSITGSPSNQAASGGAGGTISSAVQSGMGNLRSVLGGLGAPGH